MKYVSYDYETPYPEGDARNFWHIYSTDADEHDSLNGANSILYIKGRNSIALEGAVLKIAEAIDAAVEIAELGHASNHTPTL